MEGKASAWRFIDFRRLWWGQTISAFGSMLGAVGLLAVLVLEATPTQMGVLGTVGTLPALLLGLPAGSLLDRLPRKPFLIGADLLRFGALLLIAILIFLELLTFSWLYVLAFLVGCGNVIFGIAHESLVPTVVPPAALVDANGKLGASGSVAESVSPALGGLLVDVLGAPMTILIDGVTFIISALFIGGIRVEARGPFGTIDSRSIWSDIRAGLNMIVSDPILRGLTGYGMMRSFFGNFIGATYTLWVIRELGLSPIWFGVTVGTGGIGAVTGALLVRRLTGRFHLGRFIITTSLLQTIFVALIPLAGGPAWWAITLLVTSQIFGDVFQTLFEISTLSLRQSITPIHLLGRINASYHVLTNSAVMLGLLLGGLVATAASIQTALWLAFAGILLGVGWLWPLRDVARL